MRGSALQDINAPYEESAPKAGSAERSKAIAPEKKRKIPVDGAKGVLLTVNAQILTVACTDELSSEDREIRSVIAFLIFVALVLLVYRIASVDPLDPNPYDSRSFVTAFNSAWPQGTPEATIDAEYASRRHYLKSKQWHYEMNAAKPVMYVPRAAKDFYLITYLKNRHIGNADKPSTLVGEYFTVRYATDGRLIKVEHVGSTETLVRPYEIISMFTKEEKQ